LIQREKKPVYPHQLKGEVNFLMKNMMNMLGNPKKAKFMKHMNTFDSEMKKMNDLDSYMANSVTLSQDPLLIR
jgi:putative cell wall-binding protein